MFKEPYKLFDDVLILLSSEYYKTFSIDEITLSVYDSFLSHLNPIDKDFHFTQYKEDVKNAVLYLNKEGFVAYNIEEQRVLINTKGLIKIKTEGFQKEIKNKRFNINLERATWISTIIGLVVSFAAFTTTQCKRDVPDTIFINCDCNKNTISTSPSKEDKPMRKALMTGYNLKK